MGSAQTARSRRVNIPGLIGFVLSILLLWWAFHDVSLSELAENGRNVRPLPFLTAVFLATLTFPLRTVRWRYLLQQDNRILPFAPLWHATAIGFMANNLLPARAGEVARVFAAGKLTPVSYAASFASIAIERVFDGLVMLLLMAVALSVADFPMDSTVAGVPLVGLAKLTSIVFFGALVVAMWFAHKPDLSMRMLRAVAGRLLPQRAAGALAGMAQGILGGLDSLKDWRRLTAVAFWSFVVWIANGMAFWFGFVAFDIDVPVSGAFILQMVIGFGVAAPQLPGYVGVFEAAIKGTLLLYGVEAARSVSYATLYHVAGFIPITLLGLYSLSAASLRLSDLRSASVENSR